jgi:peptide/nickel transport system permease protein
MSLLFQVAPVAAGFPAQRARKLLGRLLRVSLQAIPTIAAVILLNFVLLQSLPGDAADVLAGESGSATAESMALLRKHLGVDVPVGQQFLNYLGNLAHLSLGYSPRYGTSVVDLIMTRLPGTLFLMLSGLALALAIGVSLGFAMAFWAQRWPDRILSALVLVLYSTPAFWMGLMGIVLFSVHLGWLPSGGEMTLGADLAGWSHLWDRVQYVILPASTLALAFAAIYARLTRAAMLEVRRQDFVRTAEAKGLSPLRVMFRHVLRNALLPVTTMAGLHLGHLLGGAVVVETVFGWPGLGRLMIEAVQAREYNVLLGILFMSSFLVILANILIDLVHAWLDPRIAVD